MFMRKKNNFWIYQILIISTLIFTNSCKKNDESKVITDIDGNVYHSVTIGTQIWMVENLKTTKYNNGSALPNITDNLAWSTSEIPAYCWYNNDADTNKAVYGALYTMYAAKSGMLCPTGWHIPSDKEWTTLTDYLGGTNVAGNKLREAGSVHWWYPNEGATNESGFTALPGGLRSFKGDFASIGLYGNWWSSTFNAEESAYTRTLYNMYGGIDGGYFGLGYGLSVRCLKD
jgi:uncharacterized protein (TIGR02145 family)